MSLAVKQEQLTRRKERRRSDKGEASHRRGGGIVDGRDDGWGVGRGLIDQIIKGPPPFAATFALHCSR